jgi:hypothetical protein
MFGHLESSAAHPVAAHSVGAADVHAWVRALGELDREVTDAERIDQLRALEELAGAVAGAHAQLGIDLAASVRADESVPGARRDEVGRGVAAQIALARRISPARAARQLALDEVIVGDMPQAFAAMRAGKLSGWRASLLARETSCLTASDRARVDTELCADRDRLESLGDRQLAAQARRIAARLDPEALVERARRAESERTVTIRPAPDTMCYLTALLPVAQGVAAYAALVAAADAARATGDSRSRGQVMADALLARVQQGETSRPRPPAVSIGLLMTDHTLLTGGSEPAHLDGYGPIPADLATGLVSQALDAGEASWLRRLYTSPTTGELVNLDAHPVEFPASLARLIRSRDQTCRTPWCDAPIRHTDHVVAKRLGGKATVANGQGLCEACNYAKEAPGWTARPRPGPHGHTIDITTPTGHRYVSRPPSLVP